MKKIFTLSGSRGVGKTSIVREVLKLLESTQRQVKLVTSTTTRGLRGNDLPGEYEYDITRAEFDSMVARDEFIWSTEVGRYQYGTRKNAFDEILQSDSLIGIMMITPKTARNLRQYVDISLIYSFYILPPRETALRGRLRKRDDDNESIELALEQAQQWTDWAREHSYFFNEFITNEAPVIHAATYVMKKILELSHSSIK